VRVLLKHVGAQALHETDNVGKTAVYYAADCGHEETLTFLLEQGAQANSKDERGSTPFMLACQQGQMGVVKVLLEQVGPQAFQETDEDRRTALYYAACWGKEEIFSFLLGQGGQANSKDKYGATPFMLACQEGHMGVVSLILQHVGPQALQEMEKRGWTALHFAAVRGHEDIVTFLLGQGAQASRRNDDGMTPFMRACHQGRTGVVQVLVQHMGKQAVHETDNRGATALHWAAHRGHEETAAFLISQGAQCSSRAVGGGTPLMWACWWGRLGVVRLLLQHRGPEALQGRDRNGRVALHWACMKGRGEVVRALLLAGADTTVTDSKGRTPRAIAEEEEDEDKEKETHESESRAGCVAAFEVRKSHVVAHAYLL
jgi:ankyrin repeat protein